jgi:hypothetical protein
MVKCNKCNEKSRTNFTHGVNSDSVTVLLHKPWCENANFKKSDKKKGRR